MDEIHLTILPRAILPFSFAFRARITLRIAPPLSPRMRKSHPPDPHAPPSNPLSRTPPRLHRSPIFSLAYPTPSSPPHLHRRPLSRSIAPPLSLLSLRENHALPLHVASVRHPTALAAHLPPAPSRQPRRRRRRTITPPPSVAPASPDPDQRRAPATNDGALPYFDGNCSGNLLLGPPQRRRFPPRRRRRIVAIATPRRSPPTTRQRCRLLRLSPPQRRDFLRATDAGSLLSPHLADLLRQCDDAAASSASSATAADPYSRRRPSAAERYRRGSCLAASPLACLIGG